MWGVNGVAAISWGWESGRACREDQAGPAEREPVHRGWQSRCGGDTHPGEPVDMALVGLLGL